MKSTAVVVPKCALRAHLPSGRHGGTAAVVDLTTAVAVRAAVVVVSVVTGFETTLNSAFVALATVGIDRHSAAHAVVAGRVEALVDRLRGDIATGALVRLGGHAGEHGVLGRGAAEEGGDEQLH